MVPLMVMEVLGFLRGVPGLFMAGIFSASMSSMSSFWSAQSAVLLKDVVEPAYARLTSGKQLSDRQGTRVAKIIC